MAVLVTMTIRKLFAGQPSNASAVPIGTYRATLVQYNKARLHRRFPWFRASKKDLENHHSTRGSSHLISSALSLLKSSSLLDGSRALAVASDQYGIWARTLHPVLKRSALHAENPSYWMTKTPCCQAMGAPEKSHPALVVDLPAHGFLDLSLSLSLFGGICPATMVRSHIICTWQQVLDPKSEQSS